MAEKLVYPAQRFDVINVIRNRAYPEQPFYRLQLLSKLSWSLPLALLTNPGIDRLVLDHFHKFPQFLFSQF